MGAPFFSRHGDDPASREEAALDLKSLEDCLSLAAKLSFSHAAEVGVVTQSAFSRHICALEE